MVTFRYNAREGVIPDANDTPFEQLLRTNVARGRSPSSHTALRDQPGSTTVPRPRYVCLVWCGVAPLARSRSAFFPTPRKRVATRNKWRLRFVELHAIRVDVIRATDQ